MKHILNDLSSMEKQSILEQHKGGKQIDTSRFKTLLETKLGDVKPLVNEVANPLHQLIGKTVKFEPISIDRVTGEDYSTDEWSASELENETFSNMDASYWDLFKTEPIKAKIKGVRILTDDVILFQLENLDNIAFPNNVGADPSFKCGKDTFDITLNVDGSNSWFANKKVYGTFRNVKLAEYLNNNLPCGGFDFAKVDAEEIPNTFA